MRTRRFVAIASAPLVAGATLAAAALAAPATAAPAAPAGAIGSQSSQYYTVPVTRVLDTRYQGGAVGAGGTRTFKVVDNPTGVSAVVLNLTGTGSTARTYVTAWPGGARPGVSNLNLLRGETRANMVTVPVSSTGTVTLYNASGSTHLIADVQGYFVQRSYAPAAATKFVPEKPTRYYDSRTVNAAIPAYSWYRVQGSPGDYYPQAFALNATVVNPSASGYLTIDDGTPTITSSGPKTSTVNFRAGQTTGNMALARMRSDGTNTYLRVINWSPRPIHITLDRQGFFDHKGRLEFRPVTPARTTDTRNGRPLAAGGTTGVGVPTSVVPANSSVVLGNATLVNSTTTTWLTLWDSVGAKPLMSNVNAMRGQTVANSAWPGVVTYTSTMKKFNAFNAYGTPHFLFDVFGVMTPPV